MILSFVLLVFVIDCFNFFIKSHFYNRFILNLNGLPDDEVLLFTKNENGFDAICFLLLLLFSFLLLGIFIITMCHIQPYSFRHFEIRLCSKNNSKSFPPLKAIQ